MVDTNKVIDIQTKQTLSEKDNNLKDPPELELKPVLNIPESNGVPVITKPRFFDFKNPIFTLEGFYQLQKILLAYSIKNIKSLNELESSNTKSYYFFDFSLSSIYSTIKQIFIMGGTPTTVLIQSYKNLIIKKKYPNFKDTKREAIANLITPELLTELFDTEIKEEDYNSAVEILNNHYIAKVCTQALNTEGANNATFEKIIAFIQKSMILNIQNIDQEFYNKIHDEYIVNYRSSYSKLSYGYRSLDKKLNNIQPSFILVCGSSATGKTSFAMNIIYNNIQVNNKILYISLEDDINKILYRLIMLYRDVPNEELTKWLMEEPPQKYQKLYKQFTEEYKDYLYTVTTQLKTNISVSDIVNIVKQHVEKNHIECVIIDYMTLIEGDPSKKFNNRTYELQSQALSLKAEICNKLGLPLIMFAQTNVATDKKGHPYRTTVSSISDSKKLYEIADICLLLNRDRENYPDLFEVDIAKNKVSHKFANSTVYLRGNKETLKLFNESEDFVKPSYIVKPVNDYSSFKPKNPISIDQLSDNYFDANDL